MPAPHSFKAFLKDDRKDLQKKAMKWLDSVILPLISYDTLYASRFIENTRSIVKSMHAKFLENLMLPRIINNAAEKALEAQALIDRIDQRVKTQHDSYLKTGFSVQFDDDIFATVATKSGVEIHVDYINSQGKAFDSSLIRGLQSARSDIGTKTDMPKTDFKKDQNLKEMLYKQLAEDSRGQNNNEATRKHITHQQTHAEVAWLVKAFSNPENQLFKALQEIVKTKKTVRYSHDYPESFFAGPRIQMTLSAAPCDDCTSLLKILSKKLHAKGFKLPIIILSNNTTNKNQERHQVSAISKGEFLTLPFICKPIKSETLLKYDVSRAKYAACSRERLHTPASSPVLCGC